MIAALAVFGLVLIGAAIVGGRVSSATLASPATRLTFFSLGAVCLLAAGTSVILTLVRAPAQPTAAVAATQTPRIPRAMVVGDDAPEGSIRRSDPSFEAALKAFEEQLRRSGFAVSDGRALSTVNELDGVRRPATEIVQMARRQQREPLDAIVVFSLFVRLEFGQGGPTLAGRSNTILSSRGIATLLRAADSASIGVFEAISPSRWPAGFECARACQVETTGAEAPLVAEAIADQVVAALKNAR